MEKNCKELLFSNVTDLELLDKIMVFLSGLRPKLPSNRLKDCCSGALALIFEIDIFLENKPELHGNY